MRRPLRGIHLIAILVIELLELVRLFLVKLQQLFGAADAEEIRRRVSRDPCDTAAPDTTRGCARELRRRTPCATEDLSPKPFDTLCNCANLTGAAFAAVIREHGPVASAIAILESREILRCRRNALARDTSAHPARARCTESSAGQSAKPASRLFASDKLLLGRDLVSGLRRPSSGP